MKTIKFKDIFLFGPKSKIKAGDGLSKGHYPFYTSSPILSKWINKEQYFDESLIFGTGGSPSIHYVNEPFSTSTDCFVAINTREDISTKFVFYFLHGNIQILENGFKGAGLKHISKSYIEEIEIPIPDLETQNKIVAILDRLKAILDKRELTIIRYSELLTATYLDIFGNPMERPNRWIIKPIKNSLIDISAGSSYGGDEKKELDIDELGVLKISAVTKGIFNPREYKAVKKELIKKRIITPQMGDLLFSRANTIELVGATCIVDNNYENLFLPDKIWRIETDEAIINKIYLHYVLQNKDMRKTFLAIATGSSGSMLNISMEKFRNIQIPYPPIELQEKFAIKYLKYIELNKRLQKAKITIEILQKAISQLAFKGQLEFGSAVDLEILLENDYSFFKQNSDIKTIQLLIERLDKDDLNERKFHEQDVYDKALKFIIELLKEGLIKQVFDSNSEKVKLTVQ